MIDEIIQITDVMINSRQINRDYEDTLARLDRLGLAREYLMAGRDSPVQKVELSDLIIYLQWLMCHLNSLKKFAQYLKV